MPTLDEWVRGVRRPYRPFYRRHRVSPEDYLAKQRIILLSELPEDHRLRSRTKPYSGVLLQTSAAVPGVRREAFSDEELRELKRRRRPGDKGSDPDDANGYLQRSQLVQMWNADYGKEEQWAEYDSAQSTMEERKEYSGLPEEVFESPYEIERKRKRIVSHTYQKPLRVKYSNYDEEEVELEEGEIFDDLSAVERIERQNERLRAENEALRAALDNGRRTDNNSTSSPEHPPSPPASSPASPPESDNEDVHGFHDNHDWVVFAGRGRYHSDSVSDLEVEIAGPDDERDDDMFFQMGDIEEEVGEPGSRPHGT
ncbi:hypothetical protein LTR05_008649 [Lithohypha guttulata]|uniref:Uncharacterized protein n=1 Tax=Lithohypha guttulata TaxID=1690604 RepID=A0AAN7SEM9_9EURO|nr:hypothetical protein LTR05_008649 [Lithohypha guttulata]